MQKILLDTDIGGDIDDAICLAYLLKEPQCDLLGITTVCGEPEKRAAVADAICRVAGRQVPIVAGLDTTLQPVPLYPTPEGAGVLEQWPHSTYEKGDAPEFLYEKIRENPHQVVLIAIGNLTNVATLFTAHPDAVGLLKGLSVMNGYFGQERLPEPLYNWNSWADPMASKIVFASAPGFPPGRALGGDGHPDHRGRPGGGAVPGGQPAAPGCVRLWQRLAGELLQADAPRPPGHCLCIPPGHLPV